ncbi:MAG: DUF4430 domain-containing protein [Halobacteriota archaeon]|nr:DUF4430 domain-containing protein [Halobacteriota archaeon]
MKKWAFLLVTLLILSATCGCVDGPVETTPTIIVTRDFGRETIFQGSANGSDALEALKEVLRVDEDGGFINGIGDIRSEFPSNKNDWFFYVNGISSNVGAGDYTIHDGDILRFDFHDWDRYLRIPALIGDFPEPFVHGYGGSRQETLIVYDQGFFNIASPLKDELEEMGASVQLREDLPEEEKEKYNLIVIGRPEFKYITELNDMYDKLGLFVYFEEDEMVLLDSNGDVSNRYGSGAVIQATQNPWNPKGTNACENVVWMVCGSEEDVREGIHILSSKRDKIQHSFAVIVVGDDIIKVPAS